MVPKFPESNRNWAMMSHFHHLVAGWAVPFCRKRMDPSVAVGGDRQKTDGGSGQTSSCFRLFNLRALSSCRYYRFALDTGARSHYLAYLPSNVMSASPQRLWSVCPYISLFRMLSRWRWCEFHR